MLLSTNTARLRFCAAAATFALLMQALYPGGYMPGSIEDGWPITLCPEGLPVGFFDGSGTARGHSPHQHVDVPTQLSHAVDYCALGSGIDMPAAARTTACAGVADRFPVRAHAPAVRAVAAAHRPAFEVRAPPNAPV